MRGFSHIAAFHPLWRSLGLATFLFFLAAAPIAAQTTPGRSDPAAALMAGACLSCHGGAGAGGIPVIASNLSKAEFLFAMQGFRTNTRESTVMGRIIRGYSDAELAILAAYFAK
jgi:cytochrome c553